MFNLYLQYENYSYYYIYIQLRVGKYNELLNKLYTAVNNTHTFPLLLILAGLRIRDHIIRIQT